MEPPAHKPARGARPRERSSRARRSTCAGSRSDLAPRERSHPVVARFRDRARLVHGHSGGAQIATLEEVFVVATLDRESRRIQSIAYCRKAIERAWEERRAALLGWSRRRRGAGRSGAGSRASADAPGGSITREQTRRTCRGGAEDAGRRVAALRDRIAPQAALLEIADRLETLGAATAEKGAQELPALEDELVALELKAVAEGREALSASELEGIVAKAAEDLAALSSRMSKKAREATLRRGVDAAVRRRLALPRYSLFTMTA
jgi:hypothetical protein